MKDSHDDVRRWNRYDAYGTSAGGVAARSAYTGEVIEYDSGWYVLGERPYSPALRRFLAPDTQSPFDAGGHNRYAYCGGDPVNRIDPDGRKWRDWLRRVFGGGNRSGSTSSAIARAETPTPTLAAARTASTRDASAAGAAIGPAVSPPQTVSPGGSVLGTVPEQPRGGTHTLEATWYLGKHPPGYMKRDDSSSGLIVNVVTNRDQELPLERLTKDSLGQPALTTTWSVFKHQDNPASFVIAPDTEVGRGELRALYTSLQAHNVKESVIYTGFHGATNGKNWHPQTGKVIAPDQGAYIEDYEFAMERRSTPGNEIRIANVGRLTKSEFQRSLARDGVHVINSCYGLADSGVMGALNLREVTVYALR